MHPVLSFGGAEIHAYTLFTWIGAAAACILALPALKRAGMTALQRWIALFLTCFSFLLGARLWNLAVNPDNFLGSLKWYSPKLAGLSLYGGGVGAALALVLFTKACKLRVLPVLDAMVVPGGVAFCLARIGCFLNGCCGGKVTDGPFGVLFPKNDPGKQILPGLPFLTSNRPVHPTQLYELVGAALGLAAVVVISRKYLKTPGMRFCCYASVFSAMRLSVLPLRAVTYPPIVTNVFYPSLYSGIILAGAAGICILARRSRAKTE